MRRAILILAATAAQALWADSATVSNTFVTVDQNGRMNVRGVATVEDVATNAVKVQVAEAKLEAVEAAVRETQAEANALAGNILSNNVVIYRRGYSEGFQAVVVMTDADKLTCVSVERLSYSGNTATFRFKYVCLADLAGVKPIIRAHDTLAGGLSEFDVIPDSDVSTPTFTAGDITVAGTTFSGYYTVTFTKTLAGDPGTYFTYCEVNGDAPSAEGQGVDMPHGVAGGYTGNIGDGWDIEVVGGLIMGVVSE